MCIDLFLAVVCTGCEARAGASQVALPSFCHSIGLVLFVAFVSARVRAVQSTVDVLFVIPGTTVIACPAGRAHTGAVATHSVAAALVWTHTLFAPGPKPASTTGTQSFKTFSISGAVHHA